MYNLLGQILILVAGALFTTNAMTEPMEFDCPNQPNCVSSQARQPEYLVAPLVYSGSAADELRRLADIVRTMPGGKVISIDQARLRATFTSRVFGFVDDVDFAVRDEEFIDVRSMSRLGRYDFGVNRSRVEKIRKLFTKQIQKGDGGIKI